MPGSLTDTPTSPAPEPAGRAELRRDPLIEAIDALARSGVPVKPGSVVILLDALTLAEQRAATAEAERDRLAREVASAHARREPTA